ncbi:DEAD-box ATP-dependent RNA helicase 51-like [Impatiens glandulifera]|uniref:DEAD-box ATP-dependent RNA helicase 51-like n=1 Tax=Impatiens glandulifera TaxID=253017 RepID=UPI001FB07FFF|nr:DEAD-box ATP-dependent RNA helicase 51-like [Impatiens glandulifera]
MKGSDSKKTKTEMEIIPKVTGERLEQCYCIVPSANRLALLHSFLKRNMSKKVMVFFSACNSVKFHSDLLRLVNVECSNIHGKQSQQEQTSTFFDFCEAEKGILLCSDVAARDLIIPPVDWIIQYDPPSEPKEYIDRVLGKPAGGEGAKGNALIFLIPQEIKFLQFLEDFKVKVKEFEYNEKKIATSKPLMEKLVMNNYHMNTAAKDAYRTYIIGYISHPMKVVFNVHRLDLQAVAASFCFSNPPKINLKPDNNAPSKSRKTTRNGSLARFSPYKIQR